MDKLDELKTKPNLTREDVAKLLKSIGKPGEKQAEKIQAVEQLEKTNFQNHGLHETLSSYGEF